MSDFLLTVNHRSIGQGSQKTALRQSKQLLGVIYGLKSESISISTDYNAAVKVINQAGFSQVIKLSLDGKDIPVILRDYQRDPVSEKLLHVDFLMVDAKHLVTTTVPLVFVGNSRAVREQGGKLEIKRNIIKVRCLASDLPAKIEVDLNSLAEIGSGIKVGDLAVSDKVEILLPANDMIVDVIIPKKEEPVAAAAPAEGEGAAPAEGEAAPITEGATPEAAIEEKK
ncbi:MAG: 50S ribosomal protein L25 [Patescibacteria group bacterium]